LLVNPAASAETFAANRRRVKPPAARLSLTAAGTSPQFRAMTMAEFWMMLPFALLLGAMAATPVFAPRWWLRHYAKVALGLGAVTAGYYLLALHDTHSLAAAAHEYVSFIALVG